MTPRISGVFLFRCVNQKDWIDLLSKETGLKNEGGIAFAPPLLTTTKKWYNSICKESRKNDLKPGGNQMKTLPAFICLFALFFTFNPSNANEKNVPSWQNTPQTLSWSTLPNTLVACTATTGACVNGKYYQICGNEGNDYNYKYAQIFDGAAWSQSPCQHPTGVSKHSAAVWNNKIVVSGGDSFTPGPFYAFTTIYDPIAQTWVQSTPMPTSYLVDTAMASVSGKCYLFGGWNGSTSLSSTYAWTPGDTVMVSKANMPAARSFPACAAYNGKVYLFGGYIYFGGTYSNIWEYNPATNTWADKSTALINAAYGAAAVTIGNKIYVIGGFGTSGAMNTVQIFDPVNNTITLGPPILYNAYNLAAAGYTTPLSNSTYTGKIFVSGGSNSASLPQMNANQGIVTGVTFNKVQPESLGILKALYK